MIKIPISVLPHGDADSLPTYGTTGSAGLDLPAALSSALTINPGEWLLIPTGLSCAIPKGYEGQIRSRSGLSYKHGVIVLNAPATIDSDYRGEIKVILMNMSKEPFTVDPKMRIAQMVFASYAQADWKLVETLEDQTSRGTGGFGSTGV